MDDGDNMGMHVPMVGSGNGHTGASGTHVLPSGDVSGEVYTYNVGTFHHVPTYGDYFNVERTWTVAGGIADVTFAGTTVKLGFMGDITSPDISALWPSFCCLLPDSGDLANRIAWNNNVQFEFIAIDSACGNGDARLQYQQNSLVSSGVWGSNRTRLLRCLYRC